MVFSGIPWLCVKGYDIFDLQIGLRLWTPEKILRIAKHNWFAFNASNDYKAFNASKVALLSMRSNIIADCRVADTPSVRRSLTIAVVVFSAVQSWHPFLPSSAMLCLSLINAKYLTPGLLAIPLWHSLTGL